MSQTGSTSEQNWPTRWRPRLRLALIVGVLLGAITPSARAGWSVRSVQGVPNDVEVWDPSLFSVSTSTGAWLLSTDGTTLASIPSVPPRYPSGTYRMSGGCFLAFLDGDTVESVLPAFCANGTGPIGNTSIQVLRVKATETGAAYAMGREFSPAGTRIGFTSPANFDSRPWGQGGQPSLTGTPMTLGVVHHGTSDHALIATGLTRETQLHWLVDGVRTGVFRVFDGGPPAKEVQTIDLFAGGGNTPTALFGWSTGLQRGRLVTDGGTPFQEVSLPGGPGAVAAVDVNTGPGALHGDGFGMATVLRAGEVTLVSAVPTDQPQDIATQWRANPTVPTSLTAPRYLKCLGAKTCVIAQTVADTSNLFVYTNDAPPTLTVAPGVPEPFSLEEGTSRTVQLRTSDLDGDAVRLAMVPASLSRPGFSMTTAAVGGGLDVSLQAGTICANITQNLQITATDGLDAHAVVQDYLLFVPHTLRPQAPVVSPSGTILLQPGSGPKTLTAEASSACAISDFNWKPLSDGGVPLAVSGPTNSVAMFPTPDMMCKPQGETHLYRVVAIDEGGLSSLPTDFTIQVLPWGAPHRPFAAGREGTVLAGASVGAPLWLRPDMPTHPCAISTGFPGVDTLWSTADGGLPPPGVRLRAKGGALIPGSSAVTEELGIEADECTDVSFALTAQHYTRGGFGSGGEIATVLVRVDKNWNPVSEGSVKLSTSTSTAETVAGTASLTGIRCLPQRGDLGLQARLRLKSGQTILREVVVPVPGPWQFTLGEACLGATYQLEGELLVDGAGGGALPGGRWAFDSKPSSVVVTEPITVPAVEQAQLDLVEPAPLVARCGQPATGILEQRLQAPCSELELQWRQVGGPPLILDAFSGQRMEVATQETAFDELIGQSVLMSVTSDQVRVDAPEPIAFPIIAEPFVELQRLTEKATGTDSDLVGVSVELRNTTECGVRQVDHVERIEGMDYVPGSARFNGTPVEALLEGDTLKVEGLLLEGSTTGRLTYVVRPRLLEGARFGGQSFLRSVPISRLLEDPPVAGCGCSGGGSGLAVLGLAGLAATVRRRRRS
ncbi:MYXO-CTERM sorting domain-containing protein [Hyalangium sp.]|uniref:MYXO-CTERM sorting domain-containing protein n=1 Tax=Hyalangium sp. TaxID=2028555 RepID=UPI002D49B661|nr:MYXO-CTERM sorting domain-containing protein [Hyalangium sp.]HYH99576.1 MYXO-CTERM sorting domain-containing protein [Hyalangium sp.]